MSQSIRFPSVTGSMFLVLLFLCVLPIFAQGQAPRGSIPPGQPPAPSGESSTPIGTPSPAPSRVPSYAPPLPEANPSSYRRSQGSMASTIIFALILSVIISAVVIAKRRGLFSNNKPTSTEVFFGRTGTRNRVYRANLSGGIIGWLGVSAKRSLANAVFQANDEGFEVVFVVPDTTNVLKNLLYLAILLLTLFIWCPAPGYLVITRRIGSDDSQVDVGLSGCESSVPSNPPAPSSPD